VFLVVVDLCENGTAVDPVAESPYTTSPPLPVACSHQGEPLLFTFFIVFYWWFGLVVMCLFCQ